jgi:type III restriction enzyme
VQLTVDKKKFDSEEFKSLWSRINSKSAYIVEFDESELIGKAIHALNCELRVPKIFFKVEKGQMMDIQSREQLQDGTAFLREESALHNVDVAASAAVKYDLAGKIVAETGLTRHAVVSILRGIEKPVFDQFGNNPEEFIIKAASIIDEQKATAIIQHITYNKLDAVYDSSIFTEPALKGQLGVNAMAANKHLYGHILYDSANERNFAESMDTSNEVAVYVKLPSGFYINTPVGKYNPDWAIAFHEGEVKHIYFVAETKGSMSSMRLRLVEEAKIQCAREHFRAISSEGVVYDVVDSYSALMDKVMR